MSTSATRLPVDQEKEWNAYGMGGGVRWGGMAYATSSTINVGTLVLDMYDPASKQHVWTGTATRPWIPAEPGKEPEEPQQDDGETAEELPTQEVTARSDTAHQDMGKEDPPSIPEALTRLREGQVRPVCEAHLPFPACWAASMDESLCLRPRKPSMSCPVRLRRRFREVAALTPAQAQDSKCV